MMADEPKIAARVLITLEEHNAQRSRQIYSPAVVGNSIGCPTCGGELYDADEILLMSHPPQRRVLCRTCGWKGSRVA